MSISENVLQRINQINQQRNVPLEQIKQSYQEMLKFASSVSSVAGDPQAIENYALTIVWKQYMGGPSSDKYDVCPIGYSGLRKERSGILRCDLFVIANVTGTPNLHQIVCRNKDGEGIAELYQKIHLGFQYKDVLLGKFKDSTDLLANPQTVFPNESTPTDILANFGNYEAQFGVKRITVMEAKNNLSEKDGNYTINTDWRIVRGIINSIPSIFDRKDFKTKEPDGTQNARIELVSSDSFEILADGSIPKLTCWSAPEQASIPANSIVDVAGTINKNKKGDISMSAYLVIPIVTPPMEGE